MNRLQQKILSLLFEEMPKKRICVVGFDAAAMYEMRNMCWNMIYTEEGNETSNKFHRQIGYLNVPAHLFVYLTNSEKGAFTLFAEGSGLKTPVTEKVVLNEENGYKMYDMANRYYSLAFMEMAIDNKWLDPEALADSNQSPTAAKSSFSRSISATHFSIG